MSRPKRPRPSTGKQPRPEPGPSRQRLVTREQSGAGAEGLGGAGCGQAIADALWVRVCTSDRAHRGCHLDGCRQDGPLVRRTADLTSGLRSGWLTCHGRVGARPPDVGARKGSGRRVWWSGRPRGGASSGLELSHRGALIGVQTSGRSPSITPPPFWLLGKQQFFYSLPAGSQIRRWLLHWGYPRTRLLIASDA